MLSKNQKNLFIALLYVFLLLTISCRMDEDRGDITPTPTSSRTLSNFDFLKAGMSYEEITERVGQADRDGGSGIYIKIYQLSDGKSLRLGFTSLDSLGYADLYDPETQTSERLNIENES